MGKKFCISLLDFTAEDQLKVRSALIELESMYPSEFGGSTAHSAANSVGITQGGSSKQIMMIGQNTSKGTDKPLKLGEDNL